MTGRRGSPEPRIANRILRSLKPAVYEQVLPHLEPIQFPLEMVIYNPGDVFDFVFFPNNGVLSMLTVLDNGDIVEIATVGNEGMADMSVFLGLRTSSSRLLCQVPSDTLRIPTATFVELVEELPGFREALGGYMISMFLLVSQNAACNRLHSLDRRCARWILMTHDRVDADFFPLTQEFLASMLGVRRPSVSAVARKLQEAGLVHYSRGRMTVIDRNGLEATACECYALIRDQFDRMPGGGVTRTGRRRLSSGLEAQEP